MKSIASTIHLTQEYQVYWPKNIKMNCSFESLFSPQPFQIIPTKQSELEPTTYRSWRLACRPSDNIPLNFSKHGSKFLGVIDLTYSDPEGKNIDFEYHRIPKPLISHYAHIFSIFKPIDILRKEIDRFAETMDENTVSVHIRTWRDCPERNALLFDLNAYIEAMNNFSDDCNFYVTSDSVDVKKQLLKIFGKRIILYPRRTELVNSRKEEEGMQEDLIELYLLAQNSSLIGSCISTFTEVAWWLGGGQAKITQPLPENLRYTL